MNVKSIRKDLFECLNKHGEQTMDDLITRLGDWTRGQLSNNVQAARKEGLATSRKDDITGAPAYKLTKEGKARLDEIIARDKKFEKLSDPAPASKPVIRESRTTEVITQPAHDNELSDLRTKLSDFELVTANVRKALKLSENESIVLAIQHLQGENASLQDDIRRQTQRASAAEANRDDLKKQNAEIADQRDSFQRMFNAACVDLGLVNEALELDPNDGGSEPIIDAINDLKAFLQQTGERANAIQKTISLIELNLEFIEGDDLLMKVCNLMHERAHAQGGSMSADKLFDGSNAHLLPSGAAECAEYLRKFNEWRRGADTEAPYPPELGMNLEFAIDSLVKLEVMTEQRDELLSVLEGIETVTPHHMAKRINEVIASVKGGAA